MFMLSVGSCDITLLEMHSREVVASFSNPQQCYKLHPINVLGGQYVATSCDILQGEEGA